MNSLEKNRRRTNSNNDNIEKQAEEIIIPPETRDKIPNELRKVL